MTTTMHMDQDHPIHLPDPATQPEFYESVPTKRLIAFFIDALLIAFVAFILSAFTLFTALLIFPALYAVVSFLYRWWALAARSATPGMRIMSVEFRQKNGHKFDTGTAFLHTVGYFVSVAVFPAQLISIALMLLSERKQGLTDMILGSVLINTRYE
ncbi:MAG: RDD family protein [Boseongicola sp.]|nr:RDD family protein [Boseongicola sp.]MDD9978660.1 RDD family protein [Boseongicola sp.]